MAMRKAARVRAAFPRLVLSVAAIGLSGCARGHVSKTASDAQPADRSLAAKAAPSRDGTTTSSAPAGSTAPTAAPASVRSGGATAATTSPATGPLLTLDDAAGDVGAGPVYGDVRSAVFSDDGASLRVTVTVGGPVAKLADGEVIGLGVDVFRTNDKESDYQLFADGEPDGWYAYLQTPSGFVKYPGTFAVEGPTVTFSLPWSAIGGRTAARTSVFLDWTAGSKASTDRAPDQGTTPLAPR